MSAQQSLVNMQILDQLEKSRAQLPQNQPTPRARTSSAPRSQNTNRELPGMSSTEQRVIGGQEVGLPALRGSEAQIKWARTIRDNTLNLEWPSDTALKLARIVDSTWWIANRFIVNNMKFKEPSEAQMIDVAGMVAQVAGAEEEAEEEQVRTHGQAATTAQPLSQLDRRLSDAEKWAHSVSFNPQLAEAAILAVLSRLYKEPAFKDGLRKRSQKLIDHCSKNPASSEADDKDMDAIRRMLSA